MNEQGNALMAQSKTYGLPADQTPGSGSLAATGQTPGSGNLDFTEAHAGFSVEMGVITDLPREDAGRTVVAALTTVDRLGIGAGLVLLRQQATLPRGTFGRFLAEFGIATQRASELMAIADVLAKASPDDRKKLLGQPKTILIGMARMDDEVRAELLATGKLDAKLTLAEYRELVSDKDKVIAAVESRNKALAAELALARLTGKAALDLATPITVVQVRRDAAALALTAQEAVHDFAVLVNRVTDMGQTAADLQWGRATAVSLVSALQGLQAVIHDQLQDAVTAFGLDTQVPPRTEIAMAVPGREEAELIRSAMEGVMVGIERERAKRKYDGYVEQRERTPTKGAYIKDPSKDADSKPATTANAKRR